MNFLELLSASGLELPSPAYIAGAVVFGIVGLVAWNHGRKAARPKPKWIGLTLMLYPYATPQTWLMLVVGTVLCVWLYFTWD